MSEDLVKELKLHRCKLCGRIACSEGEEYCSICRVELKKIELLAEFIAKRLKELLVVK